MGAVGSIDILLPFYNAAPELPWQWCSMEVKCGDTAAGSDTGVLKKTQIIEV